MKTDIGSITDCLAYLGFDDRACLEAQTVYRRDVPGGLLRLLRKYRCGLVEDMHESQKKVDCMDLMIRSIEKAEQEGK